MSVFNYKSDYVYKTPYSQMMFFAIKNSPHGIAKTCARHKPLIVIASNLEIPIYRDNVIQIPLQVACDTQKFVEIALQAAQESQHTIVIIS